MEDTFDSVILIHADNLPDSLSARAKWTFRA